MNAFTFNKRVQIDMDLMYKDFSGATGLRSHCSGHISFESDGFEYKRISMQFYRMKVKAHDTGEIRRVDNLLVNLENERHVRSWDTSDYTWVYLGEMPPFKTPEEAVDILFGILKDAYVNEVKTDEQKQE